MKINAQSEQKNRPYDETNNKAIKTNININGNNKTIQAIPGEPDLQIKFRTQVQKRI